MSWLTPNLDAIPRSLRVLALWLCWSARTREGKPTKVPVSPETGHDTDATRAAWTFDEAAAGLARHRFDGVGFALDGSGVVGVDFDHVRDPETGAILPDALAHIRALGSYAEVSPSGTGVRVFVLGTKPGPRCKRRGAFDGYDVEVYDTGRFLTVTGHRLDGAPAEVHAAPDALAALYEIIDPPHEERRQRPTGPTGATDAEVLARVFGARNGAKAERLYRGDASAYDGDASAADLALVNCLAFWTQDAGQIDRLFRGSGLMRPKWDEQRGATTYGERTVDRVLADLRESYDWDRAGHDDRAGASPTAAAPERGDDGGEAGTATIPERVFRLLPPAFADACGRFDRWGERHGFLTALLVFLSGALPFVRFRYSRTYFSPHLFAFLVGRAGSGKGVVALAQRWVEPVDDLLTQTSTEEIQAWQAKKAERDRLRRSRKAADREELKLLEETDPLGDEPTPRYLLLGDDSTGAGMFDGLAHNGEGATLATTEADTLTDSNKKEHGRFLALVRKAFHHERHAETRRGSGRTVIREPRLALLLAGTADQVPGLFERGLSDGLFSRFCFYRLAGGLQYESQREVSEDTEFDRVTEARGADALAIYRALTGRAVDAEGRTAPLYVDFPVRWWDRMDDGLSALYSRLFIDGDANDDLQASVKRAAVVTYRIAAVLAVWRAYGAGVDLRLAPSLTVGDEDAEAALALGLVYLENAFTQAADLARRYALRQSLDLGGADRATVADRDEIDRLPQPFTAADVEDVLGVSKATSYRRLKAWAEAELTAEVPGSSPTAYRKADPPAAPPFRGDGLATEAPDLAAAWDGLPDLPEIDPDAEPPF